MANNTYRWKNTDIWGPRRGVGVSHVRCSNNDMILDVHVHYYVISEGQYRFHLNKTELTLSL